jgi:hypothetical protein
MAFVAPLVAGMGGWGTVAAVAAAGVTAYSAVQAGKSRQAADNFNAESAQQEAKAKSDLIRKESDRRIGTIRANLGKSGATSAGTPLMVLAESAANGEIDAMNAQYTGDRQAALYRASGANSRRQGNLQAGTSLLSAYGNING